MIAAPQPVAQTERAQPKTKPTKDTIIGGLFYRAARRLLSREDAPAPKPKKTGRKRGGDQQRAVLLKRITKKFRKRAVDLTEPPDDRPTYDPDFWHWHRQRTAPVVFDDPAPGFRNGSNYPSARL